MNLAAFRLAREVADEGNELFSVSLAEPMSTHLGADETNQNVVTF